MTDRKSELGDFLKSISSGRVKTESFDNTVDEEVYAMYFTLEFDETEQHLNIPNSSVQVRGKHVIEFDIRLGNVTEDCVYEAMDGIRRDFHVQDIDDGGRMDKHVMHLRAYQSAMPIEVFMGGFRKFLRNFEPEKR